MEKDTVSMYFVLAALTGLKRPAQLRALDAAGIAAELLATPDARVSARSFSALWMGVAKALDDEFFGLDTRRMKVGSFALLCHAVIDCGTLERGMRQALRGFAIFLDEIDGELVVDGETAFIELHNRIAPPEARRFADETMLVMLHGLMCWLAGKRIALSRAEFAFPAPPHAREYQVMFSEHLGFNAPRTRIGFDACVLDAPIIQTRDSLKAFLRNAPQSVFLKYKNIDSWTARLKRRLKRNFGRNIAGTPEWPTLEQVAAEFHVAPSTIRRRLEAEGSTYQSLKDDLRRDAAIHHLCHSRLSITDIALQLGFQEPSAFHRAFKKWSGVQPGEYRSQNFADSKVGVGRV
jgi:AraC-like DNA-binding protein